MTSVLDLGAGKMSTFGGPSDEGVGPNEGLALVNPNDLAAWPWCGLFLPSQPEGTTGLGRRLNPRAYYLAMRWDEVLKPHGLLYFTPKGERNLIVSMLLRLAVVRVSNPLTGACRFAHPVDYGPGDGRVVDGVRDPDTERLCDLSPRLALDLGLVTDNQARCELILPKVDGAP